MVFKKDVNVQQTETESVGNFWKTLKKATPVMSVVYRKNGKSRAGVKLKKNKKQKFRKAQDNFL